MKAIRYLCIHNNTDIMSQITENTIIVRREDLRNALDALTHGCAKLVSLEYMNDQIGVIATDCNGCPEFDLSDNGIEPILLETNYLDGEDLYRFPESLTVEQVLADNGVSEDEIADIMKDIAYSK